MSRVGEIGVKTEHLVYYDTSNIRRAMLLPEVSGASNVPTQGIARGDNGLVYKDEDGKARKLPGTTTGGSFNLNGHLAIHGDYLVFKDNSGTERKLLGDIDVAVQPTFTLETGNGPQGSVRITITPTNYSDLTRNYLDTKTFVGVRPDNGSQIIENDWEWTERAFSTSISVQSYQNNGLIDNKEYDIRLGHLVRVSDPVFRFDPPEAPVGFYTDYNQAYSGIQSIITEQVVVIPNDTPVPGNRTYSTPVLSEPGEISASWDASQSYDVQLQLEKYTGSGGIGGWSQETLVRKNTGTSGGSHSFTGLNEGDYRIKMRYKTDAGSSNWSPYSQTLTIYASGL